MRTNVLISTALMAACLSCASAKKVNGNGNVITRTIEVEEYSGVALKNLHTSSLFLNNIMTAHDFTPNFTYHQSDKTRLEVTTDENVFPYLCIQVKEGILYVKIDENIDIRPSRLELDGSSPMLRRVKVSSGADFVLAGNFRGDSLNISISGGGDFEAKAPLDIQSGDFSVSGGGDLDIYNLTCQRLEAHVSGGSDAELRGASEVANFRVSGGGDLDASKLKAEDVSARVSGGGDLRVFAEGTLDATASGGGDIYYKGCAEVNTSTSGGGDIHHIN